MAKRRVPSEITLDEVGTEVVLTYLGDIQQYANKRSLALTKILLKMHGLDDENPQDWNIIQPGPNTGTEDWMFVRRKDTQPAEVVEPQSK